MKNVLRVMVLVFCVSKLSAQQIPLTSQYMFNNYLLNPAEAGTKDYISGALSARAQWAGLEGSPNTQFFSVQSKVGERMGLGGFIYKDATGPIKEQGIQLSYAYHLDVTHASKISFSVAGMLFSHDIDRGAFKPEEGGDNALNSLKTNAISPDINFGILYYSENYKVGLSVPQLLQNDIYSSTTDSANNVLARHYNLYGEYRFVVNDKIDVVPSTLMKYVAGAPFQFDLSARGIYDEKYWFGLSYRFNNAVVIYAGLHYNDFSFGYAYDFTLTDINAHSSGGHEIYLAYRLYKKGSTSSKKFRSGLF